MKASIVFILMLVAMMVFILDYQKHATKTNRIETAKTIQKGIY